MIAENLMIFFIDFTRKAFARVDMFYGYQRTSHAKFQNSGIYFYGYLAYFTGVSIDSIRIFKQW